MTICLRDDIKPALVFLPRLTVSIRNLSNQTMSHRLLVNPGTPQAWEIPLKLGVNRIGRGDDNDFTISHQSVSTHHVEITVTEQGVRLRDLGSTNGTFINRAAVTEAELLSGQHVQFGAVDMVFESRSAAAPVPVARMTAAAPVAPAPAPAGLRINRAAPETHAAPAAAPAAGFTPVAQATGFRPGTAQSEDSDKPRNFALSLVGVFLGAIIGLVVWHLVFRVTGKNYGVLAIGIGVLAGAAPQVLGHYRGKLMGVLAATVALLAILTAQFLNTRLEMASDREDSITWYYEEEMEIAKAVTKAVPNGTEEEIRAYIAKEESYGEFQVKPEDVDAEEVQEWQKELPKYRDLAAGKITAEQLYVQDVEANEHEFVTKLDRIFFILEVVGVFNIVNIFIGVGAAFLTAKGDE
jgi:hypothetical protein